MLLKLAFWTLSKLNLEDWLVNVGALEGEVPFAGIKDTFFIGILLLARFVESPSGD